MTKASDEADMLAEMFGGRPAEERTVRMPLPPGGAGPARPAAAVPPAPARPRAALVAALALIAAALLGLIAILGGQALAGAILATARPEGEGAAWAAGAAYSLCIFVPMLGMAAVAGWATDVNPFAPGRAAGRMALIGGLAGAGGVAAAFGAAWLAGAAGVGVEATGASGVLLAGALVVLVQCAAEEVLLRGWVQPVVARAWGGWAAVLLAALLFAALHLAGGARSPVALLNLLLGGILFGLLALRGGGIAGAVAAHYAWNLVEMLVLGLDPNPGVGSFGALVDLDLTGAALWGGSDEGLNASLTMTVALLVLLLSLSLVLRGARR